jgi:hypothetical protein
MFALVVCVAGKPAGEVDDLLARVAELEGQVAAETGGKVDGNLQMIFKRSGTGSKLPMGIFKIGNREQARDSDRQELITKIEPKMMFKRMVHFDDAFAIRSADQDFRAKISVTMNTEAETAKTYPYRLGFKNLMYEDDAHSIELKHGDAGYAWIAPKGGEVEHLTDAIHEFTLRNSDKEEIMTVYLRHRTETE